MPLRLQLVAMHKDYNIMLHLDRFTSGEMKHRENAFDIRKFFDTAE